jgi:isopentenyl-diphosphate delta-isomerase
MQEVPTETFDVLDCRGVKTGGIIARDEAHRTGVWHGAFHCLIIYERNGREYALFQKRAAQKNIAPGKFDVSVGGHYASGEDAEIAGPREIREELGLSVGFQELLSLGRRTFVYCFDKGMTEYEFQDVFFLPREVRPDMLVLQSDEVDGVLEMKVEEGIQLFSGKTATVTGYLFRYPRAGEYASISADDFVPSHDKYYLKLLLLARRYFAGGQEPLLI